VHIPRRHHPQTTPRGDRGECVVGVGVGGELVVDQLHHHPTRTEQTDQPINLGLSRGRAAVGESATNDPLPTPRQHGPLPTAGAGQILQVEPGPVLLPTRQMPLRDNPRQPSIPRQATGQNQQMITFRIRDSRLRAWQTHRQLRPVDRGQIQLRGGLGEHRRPVKAVMIGQRQTVQTEPDRLLHQPLRRRSPVQEAEVRMGAQLRIRNHRTRRSHHPRRRLVRGAL
jgi:hypothetical protein